MINAAKPTPRPRPTTLPTTATTAPWRRKMPITWRPVRPAARSRPISRVCSLSVMASVLATRNEPTTSATSPNRKAMPANPCCARLSWISVSANRSTMNGSVIWLFRAASTSGPRPSSTTRSTKVTGGCVSNASSRNARSMTSTLPCWSAPTPRSPSRPDDPRVRHPGIRAGEDAAHPPPPGRARWPRPRSAGCPPGGRESGRSPPRGRRCGPWPRSRGSTPRASSGAKIFSSGPPTVEVLMRRSATGAACTHARDPPQVLHRARLESTGVERANPQLGLAEDLLRRSFDRLAGCLVGEQRPRYQGHSQRDADDGQRGAKGPRGQATPGEGRQAHRPRGPARPGG